MAKSELGCVEAARLNSVAFKSVNENPLLRSGLIASLVVVVTSYSRVVISQWEPPRFAWVSSLRSSLWLLASYTAVE